MFLFFFGCLVVFLFCFYLLVGWVDIFEGLKLSNINSRERDLGKWYQSDLNRF